MDDPMPAADAPAYEAEDYDDADEDEEDEGEEEETGAGSGKRGARGDDDEYDLRQFGIYQALPVEGEPDWSTGEGRWRQWCRTMAAKHMRSGPLAALLPLGRTICVTRGAVDPLCSTQRSPAWPLAQM